MRTLLAALTALLLFATPVVAEGMGDGIRLYRAGDYREALRIFTNHSHGIVAQRYLGHMYYKGQAVHQDYVQAAEWYLKSAKQGDEDTYYKLGVMYAKGQGVDQSDIETYAWWNAAAESQRGGSEIISRSMRARDTLAKFMSEGELAKAKKLAGDYWKKYVLD